MHINRNTIQEIMQKNGTSEAFFEYLRQRERNARGGQSSVQSIRQQMESSGFSAAPQELLSTLRELERAGIIEMHGDKFRWKVGIKDVARVINPGRKVVPAPQTKSVAVCLNNMRKFSANLPTDLTKEEIKFICDFLMQEVK